jgi:hypothetical protein
MYSNKSLEELVQSEKKLIFIHTPKCAGSYVAKILSHLKIQNNYHNQATESIQNEGITFTVIRHPVERFESLLNFRLCEENKHRKDWPAHLKYVYDDENVTLNEILSKMTDRQILRFSPYNTLTYWTKNVDVIITLEKLPIMLKYFGYTYDENLFTPRNVSKKIRGKLNEENINRLKLLYNDDIILFNKVIESSQA